MKACAISSKPIEEEHMAQWSRVMSRCRIDPDVYLNAYSEKAKQIAQQKVIEYDEERVNQMLKERP